MSERTDMTEKPEATDRPRESLVTLIPRLAKFLWHLVKEPRVPWTVKAALGGMAVYLASPVDLIPDWIPGAGYLDDIVLVAIGINYIFAKIPEDVIIEHWGEDVQLLKRFRRERKKKA